MGFAPPVQFEPVDQSPLMPAVFQLAEVRRGEPAGTGAGCGALLKCVQGVEGKLPIREGMASGVSTDAIA